jgi:hypothetical protein
MAAEYSAVAALADIEYAPSAFGESRNECTAAISEYRLSGGESL